MFTHVGSGLFFQREETGSVTVAVTNDKKEPRSGNVEFQMTMPAGIFASVMCCMSHAGEETGRWYEAMRFLGVGWEGVTVNG